MGFSDQEEELTNSPETPETGEIETELASTEVETSETQLESVAQDSESPGSEDANADGDHEKASDESALDTAAQSEEEVETQETELEEAPVDEPAEDLEPAIVVQDEGPPTEDLIVEPEGDETQLAAASAQADSTEDTDDVDLSFLDEDQEASDESEEDGRSWYVVHCYSGYENKVRHNLEQRIETMGMKNMIFDIVVPTEEEIEVKEGKRRTVERRVFPGYILVNMIMTEESWYVVRNTPGVTGFVGMGNTPTPLRPEEVSQIIKRMEAEAPRIKVTFKAGERVRIVDGPFNDFRGTVSEIDMERAKVRVMVNFFGRETPVELDFLQVEKT